MKAATVEAGIHPCADALLSNEGLEPVQWYCQLRGRIYLPEHRLLIALLLDAYRLLFVCRRGRRPADIRERRHAIEWVRDERDGEDSPYAFPLVQVCRELGLQANVVRATFLAGYAGTIERRRNRLRTAAGYVVEAPPKQRSHQAKHEAA